MTATPAQVSPVVKPVTAPEHAKAWWRFPFLWLVVGGPLVVVVAATVTAVIAIRGADEVLPRDDGLRNGAASHQPAEGDALTPAVQARNHAASPKQP